MLGQAARRQAVPAPGADGRSAVGPRVLKGAHRGVSVDEAVTVTEDEFGARTLGDLVRRGRHFGLEVHVLTQRVTDWFDSRIGRTIQSVAASKWLGQMEARELYDMAASLGRAPEERGGIEKAGQGEGLLVTTGRRV